MKRRTLIKSAVSASFITITAGCSAAEEQPTVQDVEPKESEWFESIGVSGKTDEKMVFEVKISQEKCEELPLGRLELVGPAGINWETQRIEGDRCAETDISYQMETMAQPGSYTITLLSGDREKLSEVVTTIEFVALI